MKEQEEIVKYHPQEYYTGKHAAEVYLMKKKNNESIIYKDNDESHWHYRAFAYPVVWIDKNRQEHEIYRMGDRHLSNSIRLLTKHMKQWDTSRSTTAGMKIKAGAFLITLMNDELNFRMIEELRKNDPEKQSKLQAFLGSLGDGES